MYRIMLDGCSDDTLVFTSLSDALTLRASIWAIDGSIKAEIVCDDWMEAA